MDYKEALEYINGVSWLGTKPGLTRVTALLEKLGRPQDALKFIHIAGTNGKGSCAAMLSSVMKCCGYRTGLFTSPYLARFNERMQVNGKPIGDEALAEVVALVKPAADAMEDHPTEFEMMTAAAFLWFQQEKCDIVVLETGLGGRLDATNVIAAPEAAVIMNIGLDHTQILGDTVEKIAAEKAGIIKPGCDCVLYRQQESVMDVVRERCAALGASLRIADFDQIRSEFDSLYGQSFAYKGELYALPLLGKHQLKNAATALEVVEVLRSKGWRLEQSDVEHGIYAVSWPGRFELIHDEPLFVVDGGHNPQCAGTVVDNLMNYFSGNHRVMLVGMLADKDVDGTLAILDRAADEYVCTTPESERALPAEELARKLEKYGKRITVCPAIPDAVGAACDAAGDAGMVCAVGSLYSVGAIRACFDLH
ncbi:MAG: bifunctional folylpolyglutamate synthase/dihydrofolate synthase [Oscillospiraceae bacterium]|nr:bifunctional folylpolyglutamate synthase/dihydrofolate synthase [Oscillospiraceae bacterium]